MSNGKPKPEPQQPRPRPIWGPRPLEAVAGGFLFAAGAYLFEKAIGLFSKSDEDEE